MGLKVDPALLNVAVLYRSVSQVFSSTPDLQMFETFRLMVNDWLRLGLGMGFTSMNM